MHGVRRELLHAQARALGLPLREMWLDVRSSNDAYEAALRQGLTEARAEHPGLRSVAFGDLFLEDVRSYREERLAPLGFDAVFPIWHEPTDALARDFVARGYSARAVCVDTRSLDASFAGRLFDASFLDDLPAGADACGERGEFHTFVFDGPCFVAPVRHTVAGVVVRDERFAYCELLPGED
jgi:uncharacterized protein (TIGR00290 family)